MDASDPRSHLAPTPLIPSKAKAAEEAKESGNLEEAARLEKVKLP